MPCALVAAPLAALALAAAPVFAEDGTTQRTLQPEHLEALRWRSIGPANMGGRVAAIALTPGKPRRYFVGYGTGGLWKTANNGTTFSPVFDDEETASIGAISVCDDKTVWVGTGESNGRNSSSWGHGVYRSTDGGETFTHLGLADSHDIPAIAADPRNFEVCYVAALGHLWGPNAERGVYKTSDGGRTWSAVLTIDEHTGACDVLLDPSDADRVYAAMYTRRRSPWSFRSGGPQGGIFSSTDAGATWTKLAGGLPAQTGRIGLAIAASDPAVLYAVVESDLGGRVGNPFTDRHREGGLYRSADHGTTWTRVSDFNPRPFYFAKVRVDPGDPDRVYLLGWGLYISDDGGRTIRAGAAKVAHVDFHAMAIDPQDTDHLLIGTDGGLYVSYDRGATWDFHDHLATGQFYNVAVDRGTPYRVGGGLQDNGTWIGPAASLSQDDGESMGRAGAITNHDWTFIIGGDGFHVAFDPTDRHVVYGEAQGGELMRIHLDTGVHRVLRPSPKEGEARFRFNWNAPFFISPHDPATLYLGGNHVFRLTGRGDRWERISEDLSGGDLDKIVAVGSEAETAGTAVSLAESPLAAGLLWAGTDDGRVHVTADGGAAWRDVTPEAVRGLYVSRIEPSHHERDTAYVAVDGHRSDVFEPILLMTTDLGANWTSIAGDLPAGAPPKVVREDLSNAQVLYAGTERGCWTTIDRGRHWVRLDDDALPTVAIDDLVIQPDAHDLVAGTHGRSIYVLDDVTPLSQLTPEIVSGEFHLFAPRPARPRHHLPYGGLWSDRMFIAPNAPPGAILTCWAGEWSTEPIKITIEAPTEQGGYVVAKLTGPVRPGMNRFTWDLQPPKEQRLGNPDDLPEFVAPGTYAVKATFGEHEATTTLEVLPAPGSDR